MSYSAAIEQLSAMTPELHTQPGQARRKFSLDEIGVLLGALDNPHWRFPSVLIAGTNGKGSTAATLSSILTASGLRTGLYTSPHLTRPNERIRVNGVEIEDDAFAALYFRVHDRAQHLVLEGHLKQLPSFFETITAMAFLHFAAAGVALAVLEVGMGGRVDATNIVDPLLSIVTDISLDHQEWLGQTIAAITREKAGILRMGGTLITLPQHPEANRALGEVAQELGARAISAVPYLPAARVRGEEPYVVQALGTAIEVASPLRGEHQHRNVALAIAAAIELAFRHGVAVTPASIASGIKQTLWPGRLEYIMVQSTDWVLDVAHNPAGAWALRAGLRGFLDREERGDKQAVLVFSCLRDKPVDEMGQILFPLFGQVIFAPIASPRATPVKDLLRAAAGTGTPAQVATTVAEALDDAALSAKSGLAVVAGSFYLVGEARPLLLRRAGATG